MRRPRKAAGLAPARAVDDVVCMEDRPLAPLLADLGMHVLNRLLLVPLRRLVRGEDAWTDFYEHGALGHPWWHYEQDERGRLVLINPAGPEPLHGNPVPQTPTAAAAATRPAATPAQAPTRVGVSIVLPCGRSTTPIAGYAPDVHGPQLAALDLLLYLAEHHRLVAAPRLSPGPPILRPARSLSLLARDWGHRSGQGERRADRAIALLGKRRILDRVSVGARSEYHLPPDALSRFERAFGFTVEQPTRPDPPSRGSDERAGQ